MAASERSGENLVLIAGLGAAGAVSSTVLAYFAVQLPEKFIKMYVAIHSRRISR